LRATAGFFLICERKGAPLAHHEKRRAAVFVDGANFYMNLRGARIDKGNLDFGAFSRKLILDRHWVGTFFYSAPVRPQDDPVAAIEQQRFFSHLRTTKNVVLKLGVLEERFRACKNCRSLTRFMLQKGVDVLLAVDMMAKGIANEYDDAYLVSADADFVPLVEYIRFVCQKQVFCVSPKGSKYGKLLAACNTAIPIDQAFIDACQT
jgi:uncharacterized LabA/DUF88 family protein